ncbi:hypothetical protein PoB_004858100 [Plakobranchus ocellatus]|uniref:Uncharacterized protein n=1 Tax=Plakobranchus ocellatus TaxID=259542 RepID=A0AAV4BFG8_9GAST|nr:hypothetical protein PoB_004858100 [Plakobranchus ocellatus]
MPRPWTIPLEICQHTHKQTQAQILSSQIKRSLILWDKGRKRETWKTTLLYDLTQAQRMENLKLLAKSLTSTE